MHQALKIGKRETNDNQRRYGTRTGDEPSKLFEDGGRRGRGIIYGPLTNELLAGEAAVAAIPVVGERYNAEQQRQVGQ